MESVVFNFHSAFLSSLNHKKTVAPLEVRVKLLLKFFIHPTRKGNDDKPKNNRIPA